MNSYSCACPAGFTGLRCETNPDDCSPNPCQHSGICTDGANGFTCQCAAGYEGTTCQTDHNDCATNPCQHSGTCVDKVNGYTCNCTGGYEGTTCQTDHNDCAPNPCQNSGTCTDKVNGYSCACPTGFSGTSCETNADDCATHPCLNGGTCTDGANAYTCACPAGFTGTRCETNTNECSPNPCPSGKTCVDAIAGYQCYANTTCTNLWSQITTKYADAGTLGACTDPGALRVVGSMMSLWGLTIKVSAQADQAGATYTTLTPCVETKCDTQYVYVATNGLTPWDQHATPGQKAYTEQPAILRVRFGPGAIPTTDATKIDAITNNFPANSCATAYTNYLSNPDTATSGEPGNYCYDNPQSDKPFLSETLNGTTVYYAREACLGTIGFSVSGAPINSPNEATAPDPYGNPGYFFKDDVASGYQGDPVKAPRIDYCGYHGHHHAMNEQCLLQDEDHTPMNSYAEAVNGWTMLKAITDTCLVESPIIGWAFDGVPIKGPCVCMARAADGTCTSLKRARSSWVYRGLKEWGAAANEGDTAKLGKEGATCTTQSDCCVSPLNTSTCKMMCAYTLADDATNSLAKRCVTAHYSWCTHSYVNRTTAAPSGQNYVYMDRCNGYTDLDGYAYHGTWTFPYTFGCYKFAPAQNNTGGGGPPP